MKKLKFLLTIGLVPLLILANYVNPENIFIDKYYSNYFYLISSEKLRFLTGWINFPIGDLLYLSIIITLLYFIIFKIKKPKILILNIGASAFLFIFLFYILWGLNYKRITLKNHLDIDGKFEKKELIKFTEKIINDINKKHLKLFFIDTITPRNKYDFKQSVNLSEKNVKKLKKVFKNKIIKSDYKRKSVKKSLFSLPLTYMGFSGYINPFTNEANINYRIPSTSLMFVINHEIAHQLGIASEKDANFISYLMLINSDNEYLEFCGLSYALRLCLNEISKIDKEKYQNLVKKINKGIIRDYVKINKFWKKYDGSIEKVSKKTYDMYLKQNNIETGIENYNESISLILNYNNKLDE
jgi:hypothetical protein